MKSTILLQSGRYFDLTRPSESPIATGDIAHALGMQCRFNGHTRAFYSVAQHSVLVSKIVPESLGLVGLLHDAAEAYIGDVVAPLKSLLPDFRRIEETIEIAIAERYGLPYPWPEAVKRADMIALATEQRDLLPPHDDQWPCLAGVSPLPFPIEPMDPMSATEAFLVRFSQLALGSAQ